MLSRFTRVRHLCAGLRILTSGYALYPILRLRSVAYTVLRLLPFKSMYGLSIRFFNYLYLLVFVIGT